MRQRGLATKLSLAIALLVVVSVGAISLLAVSMSRRSLREQAFTANLTAAILAARAVEQYVADAEALLGAHAPISRFGWAVVATKPTAVALAPADRLRVWLLAMATICAALAVVLGWHLARALTGPLSRLATATDRLAAGDFEVRVFPEGRDEVAALAASFNRMAEQLQASTAARRRTEETLERYAERLRILHEIDRAIIAAVAPEEIAAAVVPSVRELLGSHEPSSTSSIWPPVRWSGSRRRAVAGSITALASAIRCGSWGIWRPCGAGSRR